MKYEYDIGYCTYFRAQDTRARSASFTNFLGDNILRKLVQAGCGKVKVEGLFKLLELKLEGT
jgi:hypothetical protein